LMLNVLCRLVFEVNETGGNEDEQQNHRDHYVIVEAASLIRPEDIALNRTPDAGHGLSV